MAKNTQGWQIPTGKQALDALKDAKPMAQVYQENFAKAVAETTKELLRQNQQQKAAANTAAQPKKTAVDKLWDRGSTTRKASDSEKATLELAGAKKSVERKQKELKDFQEKTSFDWMDATARQLYEQSEKANSQTERQIEAELKQAKDNLAKLGVERLPDEDRAQFRQYVESRDQKNSVFRNDISWFGDYNKQNEIEKTLTEKYGSEQFRMIADAYAETMHEEEAKKAAADAAAATEKHPILQNLLGSPARVLGSVDAIPNRIADVITGNENPSAYTPNNYIENYGNAVTGKSVQMLEGENPNIFRKALSYGYQGVVNASDTVLRGLVGGGAAGGALLAAGSTFNKTISDAMERGATSDQAYLLATANAAIEYLAEKLPLDEMIKVSKGGGSKSLIIDIGRQAGIEIFEEEATLVGNLLADAAIMQDKSEYKLNVAMLMTQGMTMEQAKQEANWELVQDAVDTAIVSGIAGGIGGFGAAKAAAFSNDNLGTVSQQAAQQPQTEQNQQVEQSPASQETTEQAVQEALGMEPEANTVKAESAPQTDTQNLSVDGVQAATGGMNGTGAVEDASTVGKQNEPSGDFKKSKTFTNTGLKSADADIREGYQKTVEQDANSPYYEVKHNADTKATAQERTSTPEKVRAEYDYLMKNSQWEAEDIVTAKLVSKELMKSGNAEQVADINIKLREVATRFGQGEQAFSIIGTMKDAADPATAVESATNVLYKMKEGESTFRKGKDGQTYEQWRRETVKNISQIGMEIDRVQDGDSNAMRGIIRQIARARKTTAWFGISGEMTKIADNVLNKLEFDDLKKIANTQIVSMAGDYRRRTAVDVTLAVRKQNMMSSLKSFARNIVGNTSIGVVDSASDSTAGRMVDALLSKVTGKRTVGRDFLRGKTYLNAAKDAAQFAALCVELDIPIETTVDASYQSATGNGGSGKYIVRTFRPNGNPAMRALYAYQKYMSYALEVSDKIFEGGTNAAVEASLRKLKNANLTDTEVQELSEYAANRRTFKDATWKDADGDVHGSVLSRLSVGGKNLAERKLGTAGKVGADMLLPYPSVPTNVIQTGVDYTHGVTKGIYEILSILHDADAGKEISAARQRQAVTDFGRGVTGAALIGLFTTAAARGIIGINDAKDKDEKALAQAEGRSGAQINWSSWKRDMDGESTKWLTTDIISSLDAIEPFNTLVYLGNELSQEDTVLDALKAYPGASFKATMQSFMDSPLMSSLSDIMNGMSEAMRAETDEERLGAAVKTAGNAVNSFIPQYVRQTAQYTDGYYRDTRGQNALEEAINKTFAALPGISKTLPKKVSGLGEEQKRGNWMETFFDPSATKTYQKNEITGYLDDLKKRTGDTSIYPDSNAPMSITVRGEPIALDGQQRETYQRTYGEKNSELYSGLISYTGFSDLPEDIQISAFEKAKAYATQFAKASVSDYRDVPTEGTEELVKGIVKDSIDAVFSRAFDDLSESWKFSYEDSDARESMEQAYGVYNALLPEQKKAFDNESSGRIKYYLDAKNASVSTDSFADIYRQYRDIDKSDIDTTAKANEWATVLEKAVDNGEISEKQKDILRNDMTFRYSITAETERFDGMIDSGIATDKAKFVIDLLDGITGTGSWDMEKKEYRVRDIDKLGAIAGSSRLNEQEKDVVMKEYMPDYDPKDDKPDKTELKYDTIREMGFSAEEYVQIRRLYADEKEKGGKGTKNRTIKGFCDDYGLNWSVAKKLYDVISGSYFNK